MQTLPGQETADLPSVEQVNGLGCVDTAATNSGLPGTGRQENGEATGAAISPIVIFELAFPREVQGPTAELPMETQIRWLGDIDANLGYGPGRAGSTLGEWCALLHPDDQIPFVSAIGGRLQSDQPFYATGRALRADGSWLQFGYSGAVPRSSGDQSAKFIGTLANFQLPKVDSDDAAQATTLTLEQQEKARAESLLRTAAHLNAQIDLKSVCQAICEEASRTIGAPSAVMLFNKSMDAFVPAAVHNMPKDYDKRYTPTMRSIYDGHVEEMGTLFLFRDAQATPDLPNHNLYLEVNMRTIGIASLIREGEVLGLLKVYSFVEPRTFDENELALLQGLANQGAQAIANARLYEESQRRLANLQSLRQIDMAILGSNEVNISLGVVLDQVVSRLRADASSVLLLNPHTRTLRYAEERGFRTSLSHRTDWRMGEGLAGRVALERRTLYVADLSQADAVAITPGGSDFSVEASLADEAALAEVHPSYASFTPEHRTEKNSEVLLNEGFVSYYGVPLIANGQINGVLELWQRSPLHLDEEEFNFLETIAGQAAIAVDNATLFRDLQRSHEELMLAYDSTLEGWSGALDLRDRETEGHSRRVTSESLRLAEHMGLDDAQLLQIRRGALLHDIGKMGIPDAVLLKPGPLTDDEWVIMRKHPTYAMELLSSISYLRPALEIPYSHHEKWDGSGYPLGLSGKQIPLAARIFAVIDVWDALCSDRPYRKGWPLQRVLKHIRAGAGTHFDPQVVEAFLQLHPAIVEDDNETEGEGR